MSAKPSPTEGGIIRVAHNRANPYTMINRHGAEDPALSWEARGVLFYLLCKPDGWQVRFTDLLRRGTAGRDQLRRILRELETARYLVRERTHNDAGRWQWLSTVYETPCPENPSVGSPLMAGPSPADPVIEESPIVANNESSEYTAPAPPPSSQITPATRRALAGLPWVVVPD